MITLSLSIQKRENLENVVYLFLPCAHMYVCVYFLCRNQSKARFRVLYCNTSNIVIFIGCGKRQIISYPQCSIKNSHCDNIHINVLCLRSFSFFEINKSQRDLHLYIITVSLCVCCCCYTCTFILVFAFIESIELINPLNQSS